MLARGHEVGAGTARRRRRRIVIAGAVYLAVWTASRSVVEVRGRSMEPTLWPGDRLLTVPAVATLGLRPGRIVVVDDPNATDHLVVKRVARLADDGGVEVRGDHAAASTDSRVWGPLPRRAVRRVVLRRWPDLRTRLHD